MTALIYAIVAAVALERLCEVIYAMRNTRALLARGGVEAGANHYPAMIALHASWLVALILALPQPRQFHLAPILAFAVLQALRVWVIVTLGPYWTTRVITVPDAPLVRTGPYRYMRHPNYWIVAGEIAALPLCFGEWGVAIAYTLLNAAMLAWRIRSENAALEPRRAL